MASKYIIDPHRVTSKVREHLEIKHGVECISLKDVVLKYASGFIPDMKKLLANFSLPDAFLSNFPMWFRSHKSLLGQFTKQSLGKHIPEIAPIIKAYDLCLKSEPIALIMLWNDVTPLTKSLTFVAKKYGIPTLHVNHGIQGGGWVHDKIWADKIAVYGERCKRTYLRQGNAKSKIVVTGNPYWDDWRPGKPNELKKIRDSLGLNRHKKILLYAPTWYHNFATNEDPLLREKMDLSLLLNTLRELDKPEKLDLVIKIHPDLDNKKLLYERALRKLNLPGKIVTGMSPLPLLQVADAVISAGGMVYEAALLGKTVLLYHPDHSSSDLHGEPKELETYLMRQVSACLIKGPDDLSTALRKVHAGKTEIPTERWKTFLRDINGPSDGKATERVAKLALEMAHKRSAKPFLSPVNFQKFSKTYYESARKDLPAMINGEPEKILEIGCAAGGMGEFVKQKFDCVYIGLEINADVARMAEDRLDHVIVADVEEIELEDYDIDEKSLDYIIMGDVLEHLHDPWTVLYKCGRYLKDDGYILASIPNIRNLNIINRLVQGFFTYKDEGILDSTHLRFFTLHEIKNMFANAGYRIENVEQIRTNIGVNLNTLEEKTTLGSENLILKDLSKDDVAELSTVQFCIKAQKENFLENNVAPLETMVTIIIPVFNQLKFTKNCLEALDKNTPKKLYDLVVVDNGSTDGTQEFLNSLNEAATIITNKENIGFAKACNQGARVAATKYLVFLNNDTLPQEGWLEAMVSLAESDGDIGIVGSKLLFPDGSIQHAGVVISDRGLGYHIYRGCPGDIACANKQRDFSVVTAACMLIRRGLFIDIEGFDEHYLNGCEDIDLCLKVKKKDKRIVYAPESVLIHFEGQTEG